MNKFCSNGMSKKRLFVPLWPLTLNGVELKEGQAFKMVAAVITLRRGDASKNTIRGIRK